MKTVFQTDRAGMFVPNRGRDDGATLADPDPRVPGEFLIPAGCVTKAPPATWPAEQWPRWNGADWVLVAKPRTMWTEDPAAKLAAFLSANPDVAEMIQDAGT